MTDEARPRPLREANRITQMLDVVFGEDSEPVFKLIHKAAIAYAKLFHSKDPDETESGSNE